MINGIDAVGVDKQVKQVFSFPVLFLLIAISMIIPLARTILYNILKNSNNKGGTASGEVTQLESMC